ncbi:hypothetical protein DOM22_16740 [Bdellovibrio sp. ZAP7]|uniref:hypothetical protein n=1 Tax=Bdellovibrio sp. ZAP7 TaxID=2231053 RepID=UPI001159EC81|nr:hypothetical protein [Bdellovibrio sp. ZAP7]QDK46682.1 hypothetical protein DOM22_16740 [Bdellovibrio sp. ZAP7]
MKTMILIFTLFTSMNAFAGGSIGLDQAIQELTYGTTGNECVGAIKANAALAHALQKLSLEEVGTAIRIGHIQENCTGTRVMPYTFMTKDRKLTVEVTDDGILVQTAGAAEYEVDRSIGKSLASLTIGTVRKADALKQVAYGHAEQYCGKTTKGDIALARALATLNLSDVGTGVRITRKSIVGVLAPACADHNFMPYAFKTKDGKLSVEIDENTFYITPTTPQ